MEENNVKEVKEQTIVTFVYKDLRKVDGDKWVAKCKYCNTVLTEKFRTTSAFTK